MWWYRMGSPWQVGAEEEEEEEEEYGGGGAAGTSMLPPLERLGIRRRVTLPGR